MAGELIQQHMRTFAKTGKDECEDCVYHYIKKFDKKDKGKICLYYVTDDAAELLSRGGCNDKELINALECIGCKKHKRPAHVYLKFQEEECSKCRYFVGNRLCDSRQVCKDALALLKEGD